VGETTGRGRQDRDHKTPGLPKSVYLYPLCRDWRERLEGERPAPERAEVEEFGRVRLGDRRLERRLCMLARAGQRATRHQRPLEAKESHKWLKSYRVASALAQRLEQTRVVSVGDREADLYELFVEAVQAEGGADVLVRAERTRRMTSAERH